MSEETNVLVVIPQEVTTLAEKVAADKREEVNTILNQLFSGTESWKQQISNIKVKDHTDTMAMQMAGTARLSVKKARLEAEKLFDAKRDEVQRLKAAFDLEDKLWLKSKQIMQEMFKSIEQEAEYKENTAKRYEIEQKEIRTQERLQKVIVFNPTVSRFDIENLSDEMFNVFLSGLEKEHNDRIEAEKKAEEERLEKERIEKLYFERLNKISKYSDYSANIVDINSCEFGKLSEKEFVDIENKLIAAKSKKEKEQEEQRKENERLKAEAEAKQKEIAAANAKAEQERKSLELKAQKEREEAAEKLRKEQEVARVAAEKAFAEKARLEAQLRAQKEAEERAEYEKRIAAEKAQKEADKLAKAPVKKQLSVWVNSFIIPNVPIENNDVADNINSKFNAFKNWALEQIEKL